MVVTVAQAIALANLCRDRNLHPTAQLNVSELTDKTFLLVDQVAAPRDVALSAIIRKDGQQA